MKKKDMKKIYFKGLLLIMAMLSYNSACGQEWTDMSESYNFYADSTFTYIDSNNESQTRTVRFYYNITTTDTDNPTLEVTYKTISPHMNGSSFQYNENGAAADPTDVTGVSGYNGYIEIPDTVVHNDGTGTDTTYTVTGVGYRAFEGCYNITALYIPATIQYIGAKAFYVRSNNKSYIDSITLEDNSQLTTIGDSAFYRVDYNENFDAGEFSIPEGVTTIGSYAFYQSRFSHLTIPTSVTSIGDAAFESIASLTWVKIGCEDIPVECFKSCSSLETVIITDNVKTIQYNAFTSDKNLATVYSQGMTPATCVAKSGSSSINTFELCSNCWLVVPEDAAFNYDTKYTTNDSQGYYEGTKCDIEDWSDIGYQMREDTVTITITTEEGYVTHYSPYSYTLQPGLEGGVITAADEKGTLTIDWCYDGNNESKNTVPAGTAILVRGPKDSVGATYANPTINTDDTTYPKPGTNIMFGTVIRSNNNNNESYGDVNYKDDTSQNSNYYYYKLSYRSSDKDDLGFYWAGEGDGVTTDGGAFTVEGTNDGKSTTYSSGVKLAWLVIPKSTFTSIQKAKQTYYPLEINSTGIQAVETVGQGIHSTDEIYNIEGMRVNDMSRKGIYIINGKKILR
ncbi:MAG: leucine-rich repeat domain-containing protein [Prevotella sp.]|nr:leucine-rich repeat domain-containing protein [Prevotella sp.]